MRTIAGSGLLRIGASAALAMVVGVTVWLIVKDNGDAGRPGVPTSTANAATLSTVRALPGELGHDVYWVGAIPTATYELTQIDRNILIRYLPPGTSVGDPRPDFLTVGTYSVPKSYSLLKRQGARPGYELRRAARGGVAVWSDNRPQSVRLAFPRSDLQVEVYDISAPRAHRLAISGAVAPIH